MPLRFCNAYKIHCDETPVDKRQLRFAQENFNEQRLREELDDCRTESQKLEQLLKQYVTIVNKLYEERSELIEKHELATSILDAQTEEYVKMKEKNETLLNKYLLGNKVIKKLTASLVKRPSTRSQANQTNWNTADEASQTNDFLPLAVSCSSGSQTEPIPCTLVATSNADTQTARVQRKNRRVQTNVQSNCMDGNSQTLASSVTMATQTDRNRSSEHDKFEKIKNVIDTLLDKFKKNDNDAVRQYNLFDLFQKIQLTGFKSLSFDELSFLHKMVVKYSLRHCLKYTTSTYCLLLL